MSSWSFSSVVKQIKDVLVKYFFTISKNFKGCFCFVVKHGRSFFREHILIKYIYDFGDNVPKMFASLFCSVSDQSEAFLFRINIYTIEL